jgi:hypothetical protein
MSAATKPLSSREKVRAHRARMRAQAMKPITIWVPDVDSPHFAAEAKRQALAIANSPGEADDQAFVDSVSILWDLPDEDFGLDE